MSRKDTGRTDEQLTHHRRRFLQGVGATGVAGVLAGCLGGDDDPEENGDEENGDEENGDEENGDEENGDEENGDENGDEDPEPAFFQISNLDPGDSSITQGESVEFGATVTNTGDEDGTQDVTLTVDGEELDSQELSIEGGNFDNVSFGAQEIDLEPGDYEYEVATDDDESSETLTVEEPPLLSPPFGFSAGGYPEDLDAEAHSETPVVIDGLEFSGEADASAIDRVDVHYDEEGEHADADYFDPPAGSAATEGEIEGTEYDALYQTEFWGPSIGFDIGIENGTYDVTLHFAEQTQEAEGDRVFDLSVQGEPVLEEFDIYAETGGDHVAYTHTVEGVEVEDESLLIETTTHEDATSISGVEIRWGGDPLEFGLEAHYPLDGDEPTDAAGDLDGEIDGEVTTGEEGVIGDAYRFEEGLVTLPEFGLEGGSASISLWFNADVLEGDDDPSAGYRGLAFWGDDAPQFEVIVETDGSLNTFYWDGEENGPATISDSAVSTDEWVHVVMTYDDTTGTWTVYRDAEEIATVEDEIDVGFNGIFNTFGAHPDASLDRWFRGRMDDVRFYSRALTAEDIQALYDLADE